MSDRFADATLPDVAVIPGDITDLPEMMAIERASFPLPWTEGMILTELFDNPFSLSYVAMAGAAGRLVGYIFMRVVVDQLHLLNIAVHPAWRGRGIGESLLLRAIRTAREKGLREVELEVRASNRPARALYEKHRFRQVGVRRNYYCRPTEDALLLTRALSGSGSVSAAGRSAVGSLCAHSD